MGVQTSPFYKIYLNDGFVLIDNNGETTQSFPSDKFTYKPLGDRVRVFNEDEPVRYIDLRYETSLDSDDNGFRSMALFIDYVDTLRTQLSTSTPQDVNVISSVEIEIKNDAGNPIPVNGTVNVGNFPSSVEISNDVGNPIPVSGTVTITDGSGPVTVDGTVNIGNFPASTEIANDVGNPIPVSDAGGSLTVDAVDLDVRNLIFAQDKVDASGSLVGIKGTDGATIASPSNKLPVDAAFTVQMAVVSAITATGFSLNGVAYSATSNIPNDYVLDNIEFIFSTNQSRTVSVTRSDETVIYSQTGTELTLSLEEIDEKFVANNNFTIAITATGAPCLVTLKANVYMGATPVLAGSAVTVTNFPSSYPLASGSNYIGKAEVYDHRFNKSAQVGPLSALKVANALKLIGSTFSGTVLDPNFYTPTLVNGGTATLASNVLNVATNTTSGGSSKVISSRPARYTASFSNFYRSILRHNNAGLTGNTREWGIGDAATPVNGAFFRLSGTTFSVVLRRNSVDTVISSGSFNGDVSSLVMDTMAHNYEIHYTNKTIYFLADDVLIHTYTADSNAWTDNMTLRLYVSNVNNVGVTTAINMFVRAMTVSSYGSDKVEPTYYRLPDSTNETRILKYGAGKLHRIIVHKANTGSIAIYDNTAGSGTQLGLISTTGITTGTVIEYNLNFDTGLTYVATGTPGEFLFIYD